MIDVGNKKEESYSRLFGCIYWQISDGGAEDPPDANIMDFERAAMTAARKILGADGTTIQGCYFHFCQAIYRRVKKEGFEKLYRKNGTFKTHIRMIQALAFLPWHLILDYYLKLERMFMFGDIRGMEEGAAAIIIVRYVGRVYVGVGKNLVRVTPKFPPEIWNTFIQTEADAPRTNNSVEAWDRRFESMVAIDHPNVWKFLDAIQKEQQSVERQYAKICAGQGKSQQEKYKERDSRLKKAISICGSVSFDSFLRGIAEIFSK